MTENMILKDCLAKIDPAMLEAGTETDALVAECLGLRLGKFGDPYTENSFLCNEEGDVFIGTRQYSGNFDVSNNSGLAFSVLWPWLMGHTQEMELKKDSLWVLPDGAAPDGNGYLIWCESGKGVQPIHFCRAVVAVAKATLTK